VVRLFYLTNPEAPTGVTGIATAVRARSGIRQMFTYNELRAVVVRGTSEQINLAEFLFDQMDKPGVPGSGASADFRMNSDTDRLARVFYLPNTKTVQDFQQLVTTVRTVAQLRYAFTYNTARAVAVRGTDEQVALAKWLFVDLDAAKTADSAVHQYQLPSSSDEFVRVFYLTQATASLHETAVQIQSKTHDAWVCTHNAPNAIVIRGTTGQIAEAAELIRQQDH
jgi:type II secretory pathway component GspD/PulD (secretin)